MNTLGRIEIFLEVARQQSFSKAARTLGITGPAASKQVMALEEDLGVKLLRRTTRLVSLTEEGRLYYERAGLALEELQEAAAALQDMKAAPRGLIKIGAPLSFAHMHLMPVLNDFARKYPDIVLDISLDDRKVDIVADGFDIVIRIGALEDSTLIARPLGHCPIYMVASPAYLKIHGRPQTPADLKNHRLIAYSQLGGAMEWRYRDPHGKTGAIRQNGVMMANTAEMMLSAALDGIGIAILPIFSVANDIAAKQLVHLFPTYETIPLRQISALMPPNRYRSAKVKLLVDWISDACKVMPLQP